MKRYVKKIHFNIDISKNNLKTYLRPICLPTEWNPFQRVSPAVSFASTILGRPASSYFAMIRAALLLAALTSAAAFAPTGRSVKNSLSMEIDLMGATPPVGFFDPLGLSKNKDAETLRFYRAAELKHGRVCMLASLGIIVQGYNAGVSIPNPAFTETNAFKAIKAVYYGNPAGLMQVIHVKDMSFAVK